MHVHNTPSTDTPRRKRAAETAYQPFTLKLVWQEIAPHTWPAAIIPVLLAVALSTLLPHRMIAGAVVGATMTSADNVSAFTVFVLLAICILMQSSVNVFNDYFDYVKGVDTVENSSDDVTDAVLVYNNINPKAALSLAVGLLAAAFMAGMYIVAIAGWIPLAIGVVGALFVALYSGGKTPISYYPIGEAVSGVVMGGLITLACTYVLTGTLDFLVLVWSLPVIIGIGLIMMTNNTCDIEKDIDANRKTLPVLLGRPKARKAYHGAILVWMALIAIFVIVIPYVYTMIEFELLKPSIIASGADMAAASAAASETALKVAVNGAAIVPFMVLAAYPQIRALWNNPLNAKTRDAAMPQCLSVNITLGLFYCAGLLLAL